MKVVMISGFFDPFTDAHLDYIKQASNYADKIICVVSSDTQLLKKKGKVNIPEVSRAEIAELIMRGLHINHKVVINYWDNETTLIANALEYWRPDILFRGGDKTIEDMPDDEKEVCDRMGIKVQHGKFRIDIHGSGMKL